MIKNIIIFLAIVLYSPNVAFSFEKSIGYLESGSKKIELKLELANTSKEWEIGLQNRKSLGKYEGMLFIFPEVSKVAFWMKNTFIPLDMLFLDENLTINYIHKNAKPLDETPIVTPNDAMYVLEVNGGFVVEHKIKVGDKLVLAKSL